MNTPNNARSAASKNKIMGAFMALLEEKDLAMINVQEVCKHAGVNRTTFYAHYSNIGELFEVVEMRLLLNVQKQVLPSSIDAFELASRETMLRMLRFIRQNDVMYRSYISHLVKSRLVVDLFEHVKQAYIIPELSKSRDYSESEYDYQYEFCKMGTLGIIQKWILSEYADSAESVATLMEKMLMRCLP